jgi:hypothetical protein
MLVMVCHDGAGQHFGCCTPWNQDQQAETNIAETKFWRYEPVPANLVVARPPDGPYVAV